ncbi:MAG: hypothetical protein IK114_09160, partial [Fibrobacter sp.]|nr:hypothetical protein [Fibrobacter sp.]
PTTAPAPSNTSTTAMVSGTKASPNAATTARNRKALRFTVGGMILYRKSVHHPGSRIPARPYMMLQEEDETNIEELLKRHLVADL